MDVFIGFQDVLVSRGGDLVVEVAVSDQLLDVDGIDVKVNADELLEFQVHE